MTSYINPVEGDEQTVKNHGVLSRRQADKDGAEIRARGGFDADFFRKPHNPGRLPAWAEHRGSCNCWDCCRCPSCRERREAEEGDG